MMPLHLKPILFVSCIGSTCAAGVPLTINYLGSSSLQKQNSFSHDVNTFSSSSSRHPSQLSTQTISNQRSNVLKEPITYDNMGAEIEKAYKDTPSEIEKNKSPLNGRSELRAPIDKFSDSGSSGTLKDLKGKDCHKDKTTVFCGYIYFKEKTDEYKLKVSYNNEENNGQGQGHLFLIKKSGEKIFYYSNTKSEWETTSTVNFSNLNSFNKNEDSEGAKISEESIVKKNERIITVDSGRKVRKGGRGKK